MDNLLIYLLKVSTGTMLIYLTYRFFFSKDTFYLRNRIFLAGLLILSIILPLLNVFNTLVSDSTAVSTNAINTIILTESRIETAVSGNMTSFDLNSLMIWFYFSITGFFLVRFIFSLARTFIIIRKGTRENAKFPRLVLSEMEHPPFSFFPYIVLPKKTFESGDYSEILEHETGHIRQGHTFDLLFSEILIAFLWFNPFMWLIKRSIVLNHEYLADNFSLKNSCNAKEYQYKLLNIPTSLMNVPLAHNFSRLIKNRIVMINKKPTRNYAALKSLIILPLVAILFVMFSFKPDSSQTNSGNQKTLFSEASKADIFKFIGDKIKYPQEARSFSDTGTVFVLVKMNKNGLIKECKAFMDKKAIDAPFLGELLIVAYNPSTGTSAVNSKKATGNKHAALKTESLRISNKLPELKLPEWKDKNMEFVIAYKFTLQ